MGWGKPVGTLQQELSDGSHAGGESWCMGREPNVYWEIGREANKLGGELLKAPKWMFTVLFRMCVSTLCNHFLKQLFWLTVFKALVHDQLVILLLCPWWGSTAWWGGHDRAKSHTSWPGNKREEESIISFRGTPEITQRLPTGPHLPMALPWEPNFQYRGWLEGHHPTSESKLPIEPMEISHQHTWARKRPLTTKLSGLLVVDYISNGHPIVTVQRNKYISCVLYSQSTCPKILLS